MTPRSAGEPVVPSPLPARFEASSRSGRRRHGWRPGSSSGGALDLADRGHRQLRDAGTRPADPHLRPREGRCGRPRDPTQCRGRPSRRSTARCAPSTRPIWSSRTPPARSASPPSRAVHPPRSRDSSTDVLDRGGQLGPDHRSRAACAATSRRAKRRSATSAASTRGCPMSRPPAWSSSSSSSAAGRSTLVGFYRRRLRTARGRSSSVPVM